MAKYSNYGYERLRIQAFNALNTSTVQNTRDHLGVLYDVSIPYVFYLCIEICWKAKNIFINSWDSLCDAGNRLNSI